MIHSTFSKLALVTLGLGAALVASAQTVAYSNKPAGNYSTYALDGYELGQFGSDANYPFARWAAVGMQFVPTVTGALSGFDIALGKLDAGAPSSAFNLELHANDASNQIGTLLGTYSGNSSFVVDGATYANVAATGVTLTSGTKYWLVAKGVAGQKWCATDGDTSQRAFYSDTLPGGNGPSTYANLASAAFSVKVNPVPEPASMLALGVGAAALLRRRRKA